MSAPAVRTHQARLVELMKPLFDGVMLTAYAAADVREWGLDIRFGPDPDATGRRRRTWRVTVWQDGQASGHGADPVSLRGAFEAALAAAGGGS